MHEEPAPLCSKENGRAILFYAGAFGIDLFWGLIWRTIEPFVLDKLYGTSDLVTVLWVIAPLGSVLFSIVFGILASFQQTSEFRGRWGITMIMGSSVGLAVFSLLFSSIPTYATISQDTNNTCAHALAIIFFSLMVMALNGFTTTFFSISIYFSNEVVSRPALPIWSALGQMASTCLVQFIPSSSDGPPKTFIVFAIASCFLLMFAIVSLIAAYDFFPSFEPQKALQDPSEATSNHCSPFCDTFSIFLLTGILFFASWIIFGSFLIFGLVMYMNGWSKDSIIDFGHDSMIYDGGINIPLKANLSRQFVQIFGSILFFYLERYIVKWQVGVPQVTDSSSKIAVDKSDIPRNLQYYANSHSKEIFWSQLTITIIFFGLSTASTLIFGLIQFESESLAIIGFAMTGLGSAVVYPGRELQRSFFRHVRLSEEARHNETPFGLYEYQDNVSGAAFFSSFVAVAQASIILFRFVVLNLGYRGWFPLAGLSAVLGLLALFPLFCFPCGPEYTRHFSERKDEGTPVQSKMISFRRDPPSRTTKAHYH